MLSPYSSAMLVDPIWAYPNVYNILDPKKGLILTLEEHKFIENDKGRLSSEIVDWSVAKIKSIGADAVKVLTWYRPDADKRLCEKQQEFTYNIGSACKKYDILFLFELLVYPLIGESNQTKEYIEDKNKHPENVIESVRTFADAKYGVDVFKLESPLPAKDIPEFGTKEEKSCQDLFNEFNSISQVPWVMLSAGAECDDFYRIMQYAYNAGASGYLAGRAIWWDALSKYYPDIQKVENELASTGVDFMKKLNTLTDKNANPWFKHKSFANEGNNLLEFGNRDFTENYCSNF
jgi:tagatose 1,6-diphosphate aldolase